MVVSLGIRYLKRIGNLGEEVRIISLTLFRNKTILREIGITDSILLKDRIQVREIGIIGLTILKNRITLRVIANGVTDSIMGSVGMKVNQNVQAVANQVIL